MSEEIVFYTNPMSRGRIARWMLEELDQPYRTEVLDYGTTMKGADYLAINPMGKVPAIRHRGVTVTECAAICAYLADARRRSRPGPMSLAIGSARRTSMSDPRLAGACSSRPCRNARLSRPMRAASWDDPRP